VFPDLVNNEHQTHFAFNPCSSDGESEV